MVAGTCSPLTSNICGVTTKFSFVSVFNELLHEQQMIVMIAVSAVNRYFFIIKNVWDVPRAGLEPAQPLLAKGF